MEIEIIDVIFNIISVVMPGLLASVFFWLIKRDYKKIKRTYGKKYAVSSDIYSKTSFGIIAFWEVVISIVIIVASLKLDKLCLYSLKAYVVLIPISTLTIAYITIVYSSSRNKFLFFSDIDIIKSKHGDSCVKGIVLTMFMNIALSAIIILKICNNDYIVIILVLLNVICAGVCISFCAYVCWTVSLTVFNSNSGKKLLNRLGLIFDLYSVDMAFADEISYDNDTRRISNSICYLTENYLLCYDEIKGNDVSKILIMISMENLTDQQKKQWKVKNVIKFGAMCCLLLFLSWISLWVNDYYCGYFFWLPNFVSLIALSIYLYHSEELQYAFSGIYGYEFVYKNKTIMMGHYEALNVHSKLNKFMQARNSLLAGCLILANRIEDKEKLIKVISSGVDLALEHGKDNLNVKMNPFILLNKMYEDSHDQEELFEKEDNEWLLIGEKEKANVTLEETVLLRNIGNPYTELAKL